MKYLFILLIAIFTLSISAQENPTIINIEPVPDQDISYSENLNQGVFLNDLSWAWSSQNACFPETQKQKFTGKHVLFTGIIPKYSEVTITVIPNNSDANFSVYAYEVGENNESIVPDLSSCIRCEVAHKWDRAKRGKTQDHTRIVEDLIALNTPYRLVIGVTGADGLEEGKFTLVVSTKSR